MDDVTEPIDPKENKPVNNWASDIDLNDIKEYKTNIPKGDGADNLKDTARTINNDTPNNDEPKKETRGRKKGSKNQNKKEKKPPTAQDSKLFKSAIDVYLNINEFIPVLYGLPPIHIHKDIRLIAVEGMSDWAEDNDIDLKQIYKILGLLAFIAIPIVICIISFKQKQKNKSNEQ
jgi:hypothetical protein